jgi:O-antigen/teichoic acid export membrane protein
MESVRKIHRKAAQASLWLCGLMSLCLLFGGKWLLYVWTNGKVEYLPRLWWFLLLGVSLNSLWSVSSVVLAAINKHEKQSLMNLIANVLVLGLSFPLMITFGLPGAAMSLLSLDVVMAYYVIHNSTRMIGDSPPNFIASVAKVPFWLILFPFHRKGNHQG